MGREQAQDVSVSEQEDKHAQWNQIVQSHLELRARMAGLRGRARSPQGMSSSLNFLYV